MRLVHKDTKQPVREGEYVTDRHGDSFEVVGWVEPTTWGPRGWVKLKLEGLGPVPHSPGLFGLEWKPDINHSKEG